MVEYFCRYYGVKNAAGPGLGQPEDEAASNPGFT